MSQRVAKSKKNIYYGLVYQLLYLIFTLAIRLCITRFCGIEALSINQLLTEVIAVMAVADLGIWQAITYYLYKPLAENDEGKVASIMLLFKQSYFVIGGAILLIGICFLPFSTMLLKDIVVDKWYFYTAYVLVLLKVVLPYFFGFKTALLNADQKAHRYLKINIIVMCIAVVIELFALYYTKSLIVYLVLDMIYNVLIKIYAARIADKEYPYLKKADSLSAEEKQAIFASVRRTFVSKVSNKVLNSTDNILISALVSTVMVGVYSQYSMFTNGFLRLFGQVNDSITGSVGNLIATESKEHVIRTYRNITWFFFVAALFVCSCFYVGVGPFLIGIVGRQYTLNKTVLTLVTLNLFLEIIKMPLWTFFNASGYFKFDQWISLIACIINLVVSIVLGRVIGMTGIFLGTMISLVFMMLTKIVFLYKDSDGLQKFEGLASYIIYSVLLGILIYMGSLVSGWSMRYSEVVQFFINVVIVGIAAVVIGVAPFVKTDRYKYWKWRVLTKLAREK